MTTSKSARSTYVESRFDAAVVLRAVLSFAHTGRRLVVLETPVQEAAEPSEQQEDGHAEDDDAGRLRPVLVAFWRSAHVKFILTRLAIKQLYSYNLYNYYEMSRTGTERKRREAETVVVRRH